MFLTFKKWTALYLFVLLALFASFAAILWQGSAVNASKNVTIDPADAFVLVIDPGHGGVDGGATAADGSTESQINLALGLQMEDLARLLGVETRMTRREDISIHDADAQTIRQQKVSDLKNRAALVNSTPGGILISIHQNSLPEARSVHGAMAFFNGVDGAEDLALSIQNALNTAVNDREKKSRPAGDNVYLMSHVDVPAVLVECGFLSNAREAALLQTQDHQTRVAVAIVSGILTGRTGT